MFCTLCFIFGTIVGFIVSTALSSNNHKKTPAPIFVESNTEDDIRTIRRIKEIEFWQNFNNDK